MLLPRKHKSGGRGHYLCELCKILFVWSKRHEGTTIYLVAMWLKFITTFLFKKVNMGTVLLSFQKNTLILFCLMNIFCLQGWLYNLQGPSTKWKCQALCSKRGKICFFLYYWMKTFLCTGILSGQMQAPVGRASKALPAQLLLKPGGAQLLVRSGAQAADMPSPPLGIHMITQK